MINDNTPPRLLEQRGGVTFAQCLAESIRTPLVTEWERLTGKKLVSSNPLDRMIDEATGYDQAIMQEFANFVYEYVFMTLPV